MPISHEPTWEIEKLSAYPKLNHDMETDVVVVGGGLSGILIAYFLIQGGKKVVVLEKDRVGSGATKYTTAMITTDIDTDVVDLIWMLGENRARQVWESGLAAINKYADIVAKEQLDCAWELTDYYKLAFTESEWKNLEETHEILNRWGIPSVLSEQLQLKFQTRGILQLSGQGKIHPTKLLHGLTERIVGSGGQIFEQTQVQKIQENGSLEIITPNHTIRAQQVVVATYDPIEKPIQIKFRKGTYISYMIEARLAKNLLPPALYVDMKVPYNYFRVDSFPEFDRVILGGGDHRQEIKLNSQKIYKQLEDYLGSLVGSRNFETTRRWNGPILESSDGLPLIGEYAKNRYVVTAYSGNGLTYAMIAGMLISDLILGRSNEWKKLYDPRRVPSLKQLYVKGRDYVQAFYQRVLKQSLS